MSRMNRASWHKLSKSEKTSYLLQLLEHLPKGFEFKGMEQYDKHGVVTETGRFSYQQKGFVFVPGDVVTLGWSAWQDGPDAVTSADLSESLAAFALTDADEYLREQMSPVREVEIGSLLVECEPAVIGWREVSLEEAKDLDEDASFAEALAKFQEQNIQQYEYYQSFRLIREAGGLRYYWFNDDSSFEQLKEDLRRSGFSLPSENEWEYLYGGGCRTLFPWGDSFDYSLHLKYLGELQSVDVKCYDLELPNFFGLQFMGDPYCIELTEAQDGSGSPIPKGGDGGAMLCGGTGALLGYLPATAVYYRDQYAQELEWDELIDAMYVRRVIRLD